VQEIEGCKHYTIFIFSITA